MDREGTESADDYCILCCGFGATVSPARRHARHRTSAKTATIRENALRFGRRKTIRTQIPNRQNAIVIKIRISQFRGAKQEALFIDSSCKCAWARQTERGITTARGGEYPMRRPPRLPETEPDIVAESLKDWHFGFTSQSSEVSAITCANVRFWKSAGREGPENALVYRSFSLPQVFETTCQETVRERTIPAWASRHTLGWVGRART